MERWAVAFSLSLDNYRSPNSTSPRPCQRYSFNYHLSLTPLTFPPSVLSSPFINPATSSRLPAGPVTFVVHVGGHLHHTEAQVDRQVIEMIVGLKEELSAQVHVISLLVHFIDQHSVEVLVLRRGVEMEYVRDSAVAPNVD